MSFIARRSRFTMAEIQRTELTKYVAQCFLQFVSFCDMAVDFTERCKKTSCLEESSHRPPQESSPAHIFYKNSKHELFFYCDLQKRTFIAKAARFGAIREVILEVLKTET